MLELLTGTGLATAAGLNAALPLLVLGVLDRWTSLVNLPDSWTWLSDPWVLVILAVLLVVDVVADKVPGLDHLNDLVQSVVRPTAGGLAFGAGTVSETVSVEDPAAFFSSSAWVPVLLGVVIALVVHAGKAVGRPVVNATTAGLGAPVVSAVEDVVAVGLSLVAVLLPALVVVLSGAVIWFTVRMLRRGRRALSG